MKRIAILGATSHIAKGLINNFTNEVAYKLFLFARDKEKLNEFLKKILFINRCDILSFEDFAKHEYDIIINCVGLGEPSKLKEQISSIFRLTENFDNMVLDYIDNKEVLYINLSSGAIYGNDFSSFVKLDSMTQLNMNYLISENYYSIAKINSEAKHRALMNFNIIDLRIFSYFSRFIDLESLFFMSQIIKCLKNNKKFITGSNDFIRDFIHPLDLKEIILLFANKEKSNKAFDVYSKKPVRKFEILEYFSWNFGLEYEIDEKNVLNNITGFKNNYYTKNYKLNEFGYEPRYTSLDAIIEETKKLL